MRSTYKRSETADNSSGGTSDTSDNVDDGGEDTLVCPDGLSDSGEGSWGDDTCCKTDTDAGQVSMTRYGDVSTHSLAMTIPKSVKSTSAQMLPLAT